MKKIFIIFAFLLSAFNAFADGLSANDVTLKNDDTGSLDISLDNSSSDIVGLQFNLMLPEGVAPVMDGNKVVITPSARLKGAYTLRGSKVSDGSYLFTFLSNDRTPIEGNTGKLFSLTLQNSSAADGSYSANITNVITTDLGGNGQSLTDFSFSITVVHSYELTYKVDGNVYKEYTLNYGDAITPEAEPTKEGYTFSGWSEIPATMPAHDVEVIGSFTKGAYKLTYYVDGTKYKEVSYDFGDAITPEAEPTKEGYTFSGWTEIPEIMPAHDVEINGSFEVNIYKVSYYVDEELVHQDEVAFSETFELWTYVPEDEDLIFNGWIGELYDTMPAHDISYKADITSGIAYIYNNPENVQGIYTLDGKKVEKIHQGVYVIRMKDGSTRKFIGK